MKIKWMLNAMPTERRSEQYDQEDLTDGSGDIKNITRQQCRAQQLGSQHQVQIKERMETVGKKKLQLQGF